MIDGRLVIGVWSALVAAGAESGYSVWRARHASDPPPAAESIKTSVRKLPRLVVPIIADGALQGYVVATLSGQFDDAKAKEFGLPPDPFIVDETFRYLYSEAGVDFRTFSKVDLERVRSEIVKRAASRLKADVLKDILVDEFNFVPRSEGPK